MLPQEYIYISQKSKKPSPRSFPKVKQFELIRKRGKISLDIKKPQQTEALANKFGLFQQQLEFCRSAPDQFGKF